ncbi:RidA family protein [Candidatus Bathyarchaeota archaeon]|nr:RidA family protein [Candidatus Bathyarchaeota archaeon]
MVSLKKVYKRPGLGSFPISTSVKAGDIVYTSGHAGLRDADGNELEGIEAQTRRCLESLGEALAAFGAGYEDVVKVTVFLRDAGDFRKMNEVYSSVFKGDHPARTTVVTGLVSPKMLVDIECTAYKP